MYFTGAKAGPKLGIAPLLQATLATCKRWAQALRGRFPVELPPPQARVGRFREQSAACALRAWCFVGCLGSAEILHLKHRILISNRGQDLPCKILPNWRHTVFAVVDFVSMRQHVSHPSTSPAQRRRQSARVVGTGCRCASAQKSRRQRSSYSPQPGYGFVFSQAGLLKHVWDMGY